MIGIAKSHWWTRPGWPWDCHQTKTGTKTRRSKWCVLQSIPWRFQPFHSIHKKNAQWQQNIASSQRQNCSRKTSPSPLSRMWNSAVPSCTSTLRWTGINILGALRPPTKIKTQPICKQPQLRTSVHQILWRSPSCIQSLQICLDFWIQQPQYMYEAGKWIQKRLGIGSRKAEIRVRFMFGFVVSLVLHPTAKAVATVYPGVILPNATPPPQALSRHNLATAHSPRQR